MHPLAQQISCPHAAAFVNAVEVTSPCLQNSVILTRLLVPAAEQSTFNALSAGRGGEKSH